MKINNLKKTFVNKNNKIDAVNDVNLEFPIGNITGLIGYNGSGKTTIFNLILNFLEKDYGTIKINNQEITQENLIEFGFVAQNNDFNRDENIISNMKNIGYLYGLKKAEILAKIEELANYFELKANLKKDTYKKLSKGNMQKIALIQLFLNPYLKYLFLDEPFDGLDPIIAKKIVGYIIKNKEKYATVISSHRMDIVEEMVDNFYVIKEGKIVFDSKKNKLTSNFKVLVNLEVDIEKIKGSYIKKVSKTKKGIIVELASEKDFPKLSKLLIKDKNYKIHKIIEEKLTNKVLEEYQNEQRS